MRSMIGIHFRAPPALAKEMRAQASIRGANLSIYLREVISANLPVKAAPADKAQLPSDPHPRQADV